MLIKSNLRVEFLQGLSRVIFLSILVSSPIARAYQLDIVAGTLEGITGLQVPGLGTYGVTFQDGTAAQVFPLGFDFNNSIDASEARTTLQSALNNNMISTPIVYGLGPQPGFFGDLGTILIPYTQINTGLISTVDVTSLMDCGVPFCAWSTVNQPFLSDFDTTSDQSVVYAKFTPENIPEPGTLALLAAGAVGLRFHKTRRQSPTA